MTFNYLRDMLWMVVVGAIAVSSGQALAASQTAPSLLNYDHMFGDSITGDNTFLTGNGEKHWFVNTGADVYQDEVYERPISQTMTNNTLATKLGADTVDMPGFSPGDSIVATDQNKPGYYGYIDIVKGYAHVDKQSQFMFFAIELYSELHQGSDGFSENKFGEGVFYNIRLSSTDPTDPGFTGEGALSNFGLQFGTTNSKDFTADFNNSKNENVFGHFDENGDAGGAGVSLTKDDGDPQGNGYETNVISTRRKHGGGPEILYGRKFTNTDSNRPVVEFAFDYGTFNNAFPAFAIDPDNIGFLLFEATRGLQGPSSYFWNDNYSLSGGEAGSPYLPGSLENGNIYELDTLSGTLGSQIPPPEVIIPIPSAASVGLLAFGFLSLQRRKRST